MPPAVKDLLERKKLNDRSKFNGQLLIFIFGLASLVFAIGKSDGRLDHVQLYIPILGYCFTHIEQSVIK